MRRKLLSGICVGLLIAGLNITKGVNAMASELKEGTAAPVFNVKTHEGKEFDLAARRGKWTVLYFYPKADTPGCTKQACAFRDSLSKLNALNAEIFGVSTDTVDSQMAFHKKFHLNFALLADADGEVTRLYGAKMPLLNIAKRWTFIIDPELMIRKIDRDVDPVMDADRVYQQIEGFQKNKS